MHASVRCCDMGPALPCRQSVAVNCCSEDPHGRHLVTLGDDNKVQVYARHATGQWAAQRQMRVDSADRAGACGMCCTWHPWGHLFATAFQCGQLLIWDARTCQVRPSAPCSPLCCVSPVCMPCGSAAHAGFTRQEAGVDAAGRLLYPVWCLCILLMLPRLP